MTKLSQPLTAAQLQILELFSEKLSKEELEELRKWLLEFRYRRLQKTLDQVADENGWTEKTFEIWGSTKFRKPYK
ncbi:MAG: hypothetical protein R2788_15645, partial [Saprospiraceae bacterium]